MLEEKYRRAMAFGKYLDQHPDQSALTIELQRCLTNYRIALANLIEEQRREDDTVCSGGE